MPAPVAITNSAIEAPINAGIGLQPDRLALVLWQVLNASANHAPHHLVIYVPKDQFLKLHLYANLFPNRWVSAG